ncbi:Cyanobacterial phytochrome B [Paramyrothecium foliicola]|nr:Cyanobacterial phytochrome B [Paramyrothecium foliicola]
MDDIREQDEQQTPAPSQQDAPRPATPPPQHDGAGHAQGPPGPLQISPPNFAETQLESRDGPLCTTNVDPSGNVASPWPVSSWSAGSEMQLGHHSASSDISTDRVFPIRSVISVQPNAARNPGEDQFPSAFDSDARGIPVHIPNHPRADSVELRRYNTGPISPTSNSNSDKARPFRRKTTFGGPLSSIQADAARQGTTAPLQLDIASDRDTDAHSDEEKLPPAAAALPAETPSMISDSQSLNDTPHVMPRFTHATTEEGHMVITGRDGILQRCEDEPIHTPGAVQGFGVLIALREESDGRFLVRYASENSARVIGYNPKQLFKLDNFLDILTEEQQDNLLDHIDFIRDEDADPAINGPEVFGLSVRLPKRKSTKLWCAIHINPAHPDLVICEFELDEDLDFPLRPADELTPDTPQDTLQANPTLEEIEASTEILSKPLRILRSARKRRGEQGAMQVFDIMSQVQEQLASATNLENFLKILVGIVKELTGFHRVMIYQFDSSFNGKVVTELVDTTQTLDLYKGLHFPASDIPRQARDLYKLNKVRLLYDRDLETARIVCRSKEDLDVPLDMSHAYLRAMSPIHLKYLANMAVRSSMSISINAFNELWGLIACHTYGDQGMRVSFPIRKMCRLVGDTASRNIERLSYASRLQARKLINTAPTDKNPSGYIIASSDDLLRLFDADFGILSIKGETKILGTIEQSQEALALLEYLRMRQLTSVVASQDVRDDFPDLRYPPGFQVVAGLLYVPLSVGGSDFIVFFRRGQVKDVKWAGNPYEKMIRDGTAAYLEPRTSFKTWHEKVIGKCREWNEEQVETAAVLCLVYGKFIEVWRQKEAALQSSKLTRLLLANSAHEVRTPLNAIINYLEIALEGSLDQETRENLARSHSASKSLIYVINDLLDLTKTEEGQNLIKDEVFELSACLKEATEPFQVDARRKGLEYHVTEHPGLPRYVHGDGRRVRQAISNMTANAVAHTHSGGFVKIDVFVSELKDRQATIEFVIADSGVGMSAQQLDGLFQDLEQVSNEDAESKSSASREDRPSDMRTLGLGLAVVARIVRTMDGQLRLKSEPGQGSRFVVQLPFILPEDTNVLAGDEDKKQEPAVSPVKAMTSTPDSLIAAPDGEITLVDKGSAMNVSFDDKASAGKNSAAGSKGSIESFGSQLSHRSDADRLIDAIQTPLSLNNEKDPGYFVNRRDSKGKASSFGGSSRGDGNASVHSSSPKSQRITTVAPPPQPEQSSSVPGTAEVRDSKTPIRAVRIPDEYDEAPPRPQQGEHSRVLFELPNTSNKKPPTESVTSGGTGDGNPLNVLIAEDDPINMKIMRKRLERSGHTVQSTVNGEDCATVYKEKSSSFDVLLMDMQMPIVDGLTSTKMIRAHEQAAEHGGHSALAGANGRVPIFAVSASLVEKEREMYIQAGFDGWILKPIDFKRLNMLLTGIYDDGARESALYVPGEWERGGWFRSRRTTAESVTSDEITPKAEDVNKEMSIAQQESEGVAVADFAEDGGQTPQSS